MKQKLSRGDLEDRLRECIFSWDRDQNLHGWLRDMHGIEVRAGILVEKFPGIIAQMYIEKKVVFKKNKHHRQFDSPDFHAPLDENIKQWLRTGRHPVK